MTSGFPRLATVCGPTVLLAGTGRLTRCATSVRPTACRLWSVTTYPLSPRTRPATCGSGSASAASRDTVMVRFAVFTSADGLPAGQVRNLSLDDRGRLWAASYRAGWCAASRSRRLIDRRSGHIQRPMGCPGMKRTRSSPIERRHLCRHRPRDRPAGPRHRAAQTLHAERRPPDAGDERRVPGSKPAYSGSLTPAVSSGSCPTHDAPPATPVVLITGLRVAGQAYMISAIGQVEVSPMDLPPHLNSVQIDFAAPRLRSW